MRGVFNLSDKNGNKIALMIWITILTVYSVNALTSALTNEESVIVRGIPPEPISRQFSTVQIDENTVWVIEADSPLIKIITHDEDGYHMTQTEMSIQDK